MIVIIVIIIIETGTVQAWPARARRAAEFGRREQRAAGPSIRLEKPLQPHHGELRRAPASTVLPQTTGKEDMSIVCTREVSAEEVSALDAYMHLHIYL